MQARLRRQRFDGELRISRYPPPDQNGPVRFIRGASHEGSIILIAPHINQDAEPVAFSPAPARSRTRECRINHHRPNGTPFLNRSENLDPNRRRLRLRSKKPSRSPQPSIPSGNLSANRSQQVADLARILSLGPIGADMLAAARSPHPADRPARKARPGHAARQAAAGSKQSNGAGWVTEKPRPLPVRNSP